MKPRFVAPRRSFTSRPYSFRPLARDDLPLLANWLRTPEVVRWWGEPTRKFALIEEDLDAADDDAMDRLLRGGRIRLYAGL